LIWGEYRGELRIRHRRTDRVWLVVQNVAISGSGAPGALSQRDRGSFKLGHVFFKVKKCGGPREFQHSQTTENPRRVGIKRRTKKGRNGAKAKEGRTAVPKGMEPGER